MNWILIENWPKKIFLKKVNSQTRRIYPILSHINSVKLDQLFNFTKKKQKKSEFTQFLPLKRN